jgi:hypothetical protein
VFGQLTPRDAPAFIEGGFAARSSAQLARDRIARECLQDEVASAERAAGWDPNP